MEPVTVWAPKAQTVEALINGKTVPLDSLPGGWWSLSKPLPIETDYAFIINGGKPLPDPRSPWLPNGVHGPSRQVGHELFEWNDAGWQPPPLSSAVVYELHVGTFSREGTFDGVIGHLDYLQNMGITHIELMPVNSFSGSRGWGYDGVGLYAPQESYGGPDGLKRLVNACHEKHLSVILDVVYNHLGPEGNYLDQFGPYFADHYASPWGKAVNFDGTDSHEVRRFFIENALMWLRDYHIDGLRIDAIHAIVDISAVHFLEALANAVRALEAKTGRHLFLIAESDLNDPRVVKPSAAGGYGIDAQWSDDFHHALHCVLTGEKSGFYADFGKVADLAKALETVFVYNGRYSSFRRRFHGRAVEGLSGNCFLGYIQNHDQVGNRGRGERIGHMIDPQRLMTGAAIVFFAPFIPMVFQGEEWGASSPFLYFTNHQDPDLGEAVRKGRFSEFAAFGWNPEDIPDPQAYETFDRSRLKWEEQDAAQHQSILQWYRQLIELRKDCLDLKDGRLDRVRTLSDDAAGWLVVKRGRLILACNFADTRQLVPLQAGKNASVVLCSTSQSEIKPDGIILPPNASAILRVPSA